MAKKESTEFFELISSRLRKTSQEKDRNEFKLTRQELAASVGLDWNKLHRILNSARKNQATRDLIILVCIQLKMDIDSTNEALYLYGMPILEDQTSLNYELDKYYKRDDEFKNIIFETQERDYSIDDINYILECNNLAKLDIPGIKQTNTDLRYKIHSKNDKLYLSAAFFDPYDSLETSLLLEQYKCISSMALSNSNDKVLYYLKYESDGKFIKYDIKDNKIDYFTRNEYASATESGEFYPFFSILKASNSRKMKELLISLDDTKNFRKRASASFVNKELIYVGESFNYLTPVLSEYIMVTITDDKTKYSISNNSRYLRCLLGKDRYNKIYRVNKDDSYVIEASSLDKLKSKYIKFVKHKNDIGEYVFDFYSKQFVILENDVKNLKESLVNRNVFIRNVDYIYEPYEKEYSICRFYKATDIFEFDLVDPENEVYELKNKTVKYNNTIVRYEDLEQAFEIGINSLEQIVDALNKYGSISNILK